jgi:hypothetical protein
MRAVAASLLFLAGCGEVPYIPSAPASIGSFEDTGSAALTADTSDTGWSLSIACSDPAADTAATFTAHNDFTDRSLQLQWVDWDCNEVLYDLVAPGQSSTQATFVGHAWLVRQDATGALVDTWVVGGTADERRYGP